MNTIQPPPEGEARAAGASTPQSRKLFAVGVVLVGATLAYFAIAADVDDPWHLYQGMLILILAVAPCLQWALRGGNDLPAFEILMLTTANAYALPLLNGHTQLRFYDTDVITKAAELVVLYQITALIAHHLVRGRPARAEFSQHEILTRNMQKFVGYGLLLSTAYVLVSTFWSELIPSEINSVLRAIFFGIGMVTTFALARRWGQHDLGPAERFGFIAMLATQVLVQFATLFLVGGLSLLLLALIGYVSSARRLPLAATISVFVAIGLLHNGKSAMRAKYWSPETGRRLPALAEVPAFFTEWITKGLSAPGEQVELGITKKLIDRTSLFHILCLVTDQTPQHLPYLDGLTYGHILGQFVPRFFWEGKPHGHISTATLSVYYGLQDEEGTRTTTIGFGMIAEAYANFGFLGVGALAFLMGAAYKSIRAAFSHSPLLSYPGLFLIILTAWSFQVESTMSIWLASMSHACIGVLGVPFLLRRLFG